MTPTESGELIGVITARHRKLAQGAGACRLPEEGTELINLTTADLEWAALSIPGLSESERETLHQLCGARSWWRNGRRHREDGPAVERADGTREWWRNGRRHREDGPAVERWLGSAIRAIRAHIIDRGDGFDMSNRSFCNHSLAGMERLRNMSSQLVVYTVSDAALATIRQTYAERRIDPEHADESYALVRAGRDYLRGLRGQVEDERKKLKEPVLELGRRIDHEAQRIIGAIRDIETPLQIELDTADQQRRAYALEVERKEREAAEERERQRQAELAAKEAKVKAEADRLVEERRKFEAQIAEQQRLEAIRLAAERAALDAEHKSIRNREEALRLAAERERLAAEAEERAAEEQRRAEEMRPDVDKIHNLGKELHQMLLPAVTTPAAKTFMDRVRAYIETLAQKCEAFQ